MVAVDVVALVRISEYARYESGMDDAENDRRFNAACREIWGYTTDDFDEDLFSDMDHRWLDTLDEKRAWSYGINSGYDLTDDRNGGLVVDWLGFVWMILAEQRQLLTVQMRRAAWAKRDALLLADPKIAGVIR
jgi:hypothetical protein